MAAGIIEYLADGSWTKRMHAGWAAQGGIRAASYTASKSGVGGLTKLLANEWAAKGINVNAIAPGYIATNNTAALQEDEKLTEELERLKAEVRDRDSRA